MTKFVFALLTLVLCTFVKAEAPTWVTCDQVAATFNDQNNKYTCPKKKALGEGSSGVVYELGKNNVKYAGKVAIMESQDQKDHAETEFKILTASANNPHVIKMYNRKTQTLKDLKNKNVELNFVLIEFATYGTLYDFYKSESLKSDSKFNNPRFGMQIALDLARGLKGLHEIKWVHADVKMENAIVTDGYVAKLIDFDLSAAKDQGGEVRGTPDYIDPRILNKKFKVWDEYIDVYCVGILMFEMLNGYAPFSADDVNEIFLNIKDGAVEFKNYPERSIAELIMSAIHQDVSKRPTMSQLITKIENYLKSDTDNFIEKTYFSTKTTPLVDFSKLTVRSTENRAADATRFIQNNRFRRLASSDRHTLEDSRQILVLIWAVSAVLVFLVFRAISLWFDRLRNRHSDAKADCLPGIDSMAGGASVDLKVAIHAN